MSWARGGGLKLVTAITLAALAFPGPELTKDQRETLSAVQQAYEANRLVLGMRGLVRFHGQQGLLDAASIDDIDRAMASDWRDENIAKGSTFSMRPIGGSKASIRLNGRSRQSGWSGRITGPLRCLRVDC